MALSNPIPLRLDRVKLLVWQDEAAARRMSLNDYLRWRLDRAEVSDELDQLRQTVAAASKVGGPSRDRSEPAMLLEVLLLLRTLSNPKDHQAIAAELRRLGLEPYSPGDHANAPRR